MGWVDPRVGLGWVGNGSKICVFSGFGWVMGLKWQMCEKYIIHVMYFVSSINWLVRFDCNASDTVGVCIATMCIRMMMMMMT